MKEKRPPIVQQIADIVAAVGGGSQRKFAKMVGCSQPVISRIVNGQQRPGRELVERICKLDGVDGAALLASLDEPPPHLLDTVKATATTGHKAASDIRMRNEREEKPSCECQRRAYDQGWSHGWQSGYERAMFEILQEINDGTES